MALGAMLRDAFAQSKENTRVSPLESIAKNEAATTKLSSEVAKQQRGRMMFDDDVKRAALTAVFLDGDEGVTGFIEEFWGVRVRAKKQEARKQLKDAAQTFIDEPR